METNTLILIGIIVLALVLWRYVAYLRCALELKCKHKWVVTESHPVCNTGSNHPVYHDKYMTCEVCGEMKRVRL